MRLSEGVGREARRVVPRLSSRVESTMWDVTTEFGQRVARRLAEEQVIWLVTTDRSGTPQPNPVWFVMDGASMLIFSKPDAAKVRHIQERPRVALNFHTDVHGNDVVVLLGTAALDPAAPPTDQLEAYMAKYAAAMPGIDLSPEQYAATFSTAIRVTIERVRGF
jgi:PPOX class probable F420-dependent enzyme